MKNALIWTVALLAGLAAFGWVVSTSDPPAGDSTASASGPRRNTRSMLPARDVLPDDPDRLEQFIATTDRPGVVALWRLGMAREHRGRAEDAAEAWGRAVEAGLARTDEPSDDRRAIILYHLAASLHELGRTDEARRWALVALELYEPRSEEVGDDPHLWSATAWLHRFAGDEPTAAATWARAAELQAGQVSESTQGGWGRATDLYNLACFRALAGDRDGALDAIGLAADAGFANAGLASWDPDLDSIRDAEEFMAAWQRFRTAQPPVMIEGG